MKALFMKYIVFMFFWTGLAVNAQANIIDSTYGVGAGSFELGAYAGGAHVGLPVGSTTIVGWTVGGPGDGVDWLSSFYGSDTGEYSVDLQMLSASSVFTDIPTEIGTKYNLSFAAATLNGYDTLGVFSAGDILNQLFSATPAAILTFEQLSYVFTATDTSTTLTFSATGSSAFGPAIDSVSVTEVQAPVPEPATMLLLGSGIAGLAGFRRRASKA